MTNIISIISENGKAFIAGDKSSGDIETGAKHLVKESKIFRKGDLMVGFTQSWRMGDILKFNREPPIPSVEEKKQTNYYQFIQEKVSISIYDALNLESLLIKDKKSGALELPGDILIATKGRLFQILSDFHVLESYYDYHAIGSGADFALGALDAISGIYKRPQWAIKKAMAIASSRMGSVSQEFDIISQELSTEERDDWYRRKKELFASAGKRSLPNFSRSRLILTSPTPQNQTTSHQEVISSIVDPAESHGEGPSAAQHSEPTKEA